VGLAALEELRLARAARNATSNSVPIAPLTPTPPDRERASSLQPAGNHLEVLHSAPLPPARPPLPQPSVGGARRHSPAVLCERSAVRTRPSERNARGFVTVRIVASTEAAAMAGLHGRSAQLEVDSDENDGYGKHGNGSPTSSAYARRVRSLSPSPRRPPSAGVVVTAYGAAHPYSHGSLRPSTSSGASHVTSLLFPPRAV
jgi:hypothetical protein